ncbi:hypothetical protein RND81_13G153200 [Saponaria officinalis]|uniref:Uncharacterized protein n=1 Tax=Saponaria officinalis TaxID=3572 RepID=A0AAW1H1A5_SAPOF
MSLGHYQIILGQQRHLKLSLITKIIRIVYLFFAVQRILDELLLAKDPHDFDSRVQQKAYFEHLGRLSVVSCLVSENSSLFMAKEKSATGLSLTFKEKNVESFWYSLDGDGQEAIMYGLIALSTSGCNIIKVKSQQVLRCLLKMDIMYKQSHRWYFMPICKIITKFQNMVKAWFTIDTKLSYWAGMVNGVQLAISLFDEGDEGIISEMCLIFSFLALHISNEFLPLLMPICDKVLSKYNHNPAYLWVYSELQKKDYSSTGQLSFPSEEYNLQSIALWFDELDLSLKGFFCSLLLRLVLKKTNARYQAFEIIVAIEQIENGAKMWVNGASLMDRLMLFLKDDDKSNATLQCICFLSSKMKLT